ncbi:10678_t:CDS:2, partial [Cetraspora pellucida]
MSYYNMDSNLISTPTFDESLSLIIRSSRLNLFIIFFPFAIISFASLLNFSIDEICKRKGGVVGRLLAAGFGNVVEMIISICALIHGEIEIVQTSLLGSIISNLLFVLGMCIFVGGCCYGDQIFNEVAAQTNSSLMTLSCVSLIIPVAFNSLFSNSSNNFIEISTEILYFSRGTSILLLIVYLFYLYFYLLTHSHLFDENNDNDLEQPMVVSLSFIHSIGLLVVVTVCIAISSECLVSSIEGTVKSLNISKIFIGVIIIPIVSNAVEHYTAVVAALRNNMNLAISISVGSSMQIALSVIPILVMIGWIIGQPMNFSFGTFGAISLIISVLLTDYVIR